MGQWEGSLQLQVHWPTTTICYKYAMIVCNICAVDDGNNVYVYVYVIIITNVDYQYYIDHIFRYWIDIQINSDTFN